MYTGRLNEESLTDSVVNPIALRTAKTLWSFGGSECNRVERTMLCAIGTVAKLKMTELWPLESMPLHYNEVPQYTFLWNNYLSWVKIFVKHSCSVSPTLLLNIFSDISYL